MLAFMLKSNTANFGHQVCLEQTENGMIPLSYMEICLANLCIARQIDTLLLNRKQKADVSYRIDHLKVLHL